jgi:Histone methylation protein DOT1
MLMEIKKTVEQEIFSGIERMEKDEDLYQEKNFSKRLDAIDHIELHVIDRINVITERTGLSDQISFLKEYAIKVKRRLEKVNTRMFQLLRRKISQKGYRGKVLMDLIEEHFDDNLSTVLRNETIGYDNLDIFLNGILTYQKMPVETIEREPEMVYYQKTPARIILELIKKTEFIPKDVFFDLGSGLGQVTILVNLLTSVVSKGVEFEPAFCSYANACAADLHLNDVEFINTDAREADYSSGTIFFLYTPFEGKMLLAVLHNLKEEAKKRKIKIFTYGPCTPVVAQQDWLLNKNEVQNCLVELGEFHSESEKRNALDRLVSLI